MKNLSIDWIIKQIYKHLFIFLLGIFIGTGSVLTLYKFLPKKYKTSGKINVSPKYFQNPMMMDFLPTVYDASELKSEREAAISGALSKEFLTAIMSRDVSDSAQLSPLERDLKIDSLRRNFEIYRESTTVFQISSIANTSEKSYELCLLLINEIISKARIARTTYMEQIRDAVKARLQSLNGADITSTSVSEIKQQVDVLEKQKKEMQKNYSANHPDIHAITAKIAALKNMRDGNTDHSRVYGSNSIDPTQKANNEIKARLQEDLMKKYQNLEIVLDLENKENNMYVNIISPPLRSLSPVSPQFTIFLVFGSMIGLFFGISLVAFKSRKEMLNEIQNDNVSLDPKTEKKKDRRNPNNGNKDYYTLDQ